MSNTKKISENSFGERDRRGHWRPFEKLKYAPLFAWPIKPLKLLRWLFGYPGYVLPWNLVFFLISVVVWLAFTPPLETMKTFELGWMATIVLRNAGLMILFYGIFHLHLYVKRKQGNEFKYNPSWLETDGSAFLFRNQTLDNLTWSFASGLSIWSGYEILTFWMMANGFIPHLDFQANPILFVVMLLLIPMFRELHFYCIHRLIHIPILYRYVHKVHHANSNPGPWSGLSMHPVEHILYFSSIFIHWIIPSHPLHVLNQLIHPALSPALDHTGFEKVIIDDKTALDTHCFAHYLHHKYFEVNYSDGIIPLDKWFGTFHDGSSEGDELMKKRLKQKRMRLNT
ncbi:MAG: sterol desaturase family protein [Rhodobacteraceae bacterium]|nr:sterol desaturase family protein [Paracoccaceae bacterium]